MKRGTDPAGADADTDTGRLKAPHWIPLGPFAVTGGQAAGHPVVAGRVEAIAAGPGGNRVYIGAADGGAWFSPDGGGTGNARRLLTTPGAPVPSRVANFLAVGALAVRFGADRATDQVFVGTGEHRPGFRGWFGIGVRVSTAGGVDGSWNLEGTNLAGLGCVKMAIDPDNPALVLVATTGGLFSRPAVVANRGTWTQGGQPGVHQRGRRGQRRADRRDGRGQGLLRGLPGRRRVFQPRPGDLDQGARWAGRRRRAHRAGGLRGHPGRVYAFCQSRRLFRLTAGSFVAVAGVPANIFGPPPSSGGYNLVLAVDPAAADTIYLGGSIVWDQAPADPLPDWTLALYRGTVTNPVAAPAFPFNAANDAVGTLQTFSENGDATYVGRGIHPDAQSIAFSRRADNSGLDGTQVWVGCDGGLFRSTASSALGSFTSCGAGLATLQMTYLTSHSGLESVVLAGCQDNGTVRWRSGPVWHEPRRADGGGVAIDPNNRYQMLRQYLQGHPRPDHDGRSDQAAWAGLTFPPRTNTARAATPPRPPRATVRTRPSTPRSPPRRPGCAPTLVAKGTNRVWLSTNWGVDLGDAAHGQQPVHAPPCRTPRRTASAPPWSRLPSRRDAAVRRHRDRGVPVLLRGRRLDAASRCPRSRGHGRHPDHLGRRRPAGRPCTRPSAGSASSTAGTSTVPPGTPPGSWRR